MGCDMMMDDESPVLSSIKKLSKLAKSIGGKEAEAIMEVVDALRMESGDDEEGDDYMDEAEGSGTSKAGKGLIIASLKKKFGADEE